MKLVRFSTRDGDEPRFGFVLGERVVAFDDLRDRPAELESPEQYLRDLPESEELARSIEARARDLGLDAGSALHLTDARFHPPLASPPALLDFGLSPRHLENSARTLIEYEYGAVVRRLLSPFVGASIRRTSRSNVLFYYKGNHHAIVGDEDVVGWPPYTSYLDIEPELGIVVGNAAQPIAGYLIFNDVSARDVQLPEMRVLGPTRSKDFDRSNGIGPYLVTPDEIPDPLSLDVTVRVGDRFTWRGSTSEYTRHPDEVVKFVKSIFTPLPGTILGMGTVPDCTGLDNNQWIEPGEVVEIAFAGLGTLRQRIPAPPTTLEAGRWRNRHWQTAASNRGDG